MIGLFFAHIYIYIHARNIIGSRLLTSTGQAYSWQLRELDFKHYLQIKCDIVTLDVLVTKTEIHSYVHLFSLEKLGRASAKRNPN